MSEQTEQQQAEQREISKRNEYNLRTSLLRRDLAQAQSMLRAAIWEPMDVRALAIERRELAVQEASEALERHLAADTQVAAQDYSWLD